MNLVIRLIRLAMVGTGLGASFVLAHANASGMPASLPGVGKIDRFELIDGRLSDTTYQINSTNKVASRMLVEWLSTNAPLTIDLNWHGSYRPILTVRFWIHDRPDPVEIYLIHEWKDMTGKVWTMDDAKVNSLMEMVLKACRAGLGS